MGGHLAFPRTVDTLIIVEPRGCCQLRARDDQDGGGSARRNRLIYQFPTFMIPATIFFPPGRADSILTL